MPVIFNKYYPARNICFFVGEGLLIFFVVIGVQFFFQGEDLLSSTWIIYGFKSFLVTCIFQVCLYYFDLYDLSGEINYSDMAARITQAFGVGCIILAGAYYVFPQTIISTKVFFIGYGAICLSIAAWRLLYIFLLEKRMFTTPIVVIGSGELAINIINEIEDRRDSGYKVVACIENKENIKNQNALKCNIITTIEDLKETVNKTNAEKVVVALDDRRGKTPIKELMAVKLQGIPILKGIEFYENLTGKILVQKVNPGWIIFSEGFKKGRFTRTLKRIIDIIVSFIGLLVSLPVIVFSAVIIKLESAGPVFYFQERVGENGQPFNVVKFRSMRADAEKDGPVWALKNDDRVTRYGKFIRKVRIDEIPQMWTVLLGNMSFVGPRPERPIFVEQLEKKIPFYSMRHNVKPGITGWAQINYPYGASEEDALRKLEYDLYYIKNMSLKMDLWVIFETVKTVLFQKGAR